MQKQDGIILSGGPHEDNELQYRAHTVEGGWAVVAWRCSRAPDGHVQERWWPETEWGMPGPFATPEAARAAAYERLGSLYQARSSMTHADRLHALAASIQSAGQGYLERSLAECSEAELELLSRVAARAHLDRQMVQDSCPLRQALRAREQ